MELISFEPCPQRQFFKGKMSRKSQSSNQVVVNVEIHRHDGIESTYGDENSYRPVDSWKVLRNFKLNLYNNIKLSAETIFTPLSNPKMGQKSYNLKFKNNEIHFVKLKLLEAFDV